MRHFALFSILLGAAMAASSFMLDTRANEGFTTARPGGVEDIIITKDNTLNGTSNLDNNSPIVPTQVAKGSLPLEFVNNFSGDHVNAYISGLDSDNRVVFVGGDGRLIYPTAGGSKTPVKITQPIAISMGTKGRTFKMALPITLSSGRIYFCEGDLPFFMVSTDNGDGLVQPSVTNLKDPSAGLNWGFVELTYTKSKALYANISYVDFVGMILSMKLGVSDGGGTQITRGLQSTAVENICTSLVAQSKKDSKPWSKMCVANSAGKQIRILAPGDYETINAGDFQNYWQGYVDKVWTKYTGTPLVIDTQTSRGKVNCRVSGATMKCDSDNRGYNKPTAQDIWGCNSGPFGTLSSDNNVHLAVIPRLCAAFVRSTLLLQGGNVQPSLAASHYYTADPTNHYSRIVHANEVDGKGYAFPYDDVNPDGENASGMVSSGSPRLLVIYFGGLPV